MDTINFLVVGMLPHVLNKAMKDKIKNDSKYYIWDEPYFWKILRLFASANNEIHSMLTYCHSYACGGHFDSKKSVRKILDSGSYLETLLKDAY